ncbi:MAG: hypothetical protein IPH44_28275 [Myxococcales bacterium]|nr:hypothetical protein [Myxococcales bacterium]
MLPTRPDAGVAAVPVAVPPRQRARVLIIERFQVALTRAMHRQLRSHHDVTIEHDARGPRGGSSRRPATSSCAT